MSIDYNLHLAEGASIQSIREFFLAQNIFSTEAHERLTYLRGGGVDIGIKACPVLTSDVVLKMTGITPAISVNFCVHDFAHGKKLGLLGIETTYEMTSLILARFDMELSLIFEYDLVILVRKDNSLVLNKSWDWNVDSLTYIPKDYSFEEL